MEHTDYAEYSSRVRGCLLGGAIGDALGAPVEFMRRSDIIDRTGLTGVRDYLPASFGTAAGLGLITDDTQMTLFVMEGIIRALVRQFLKGIGFTTAVTHHAMQRWLDTQEYTGPTGERDGWLINEEWLYSRRAPGNTCLSALRASKSQGFGNAAQNDSKGCGGVMRSAPWGFMILRAGDQEIYDSACESAGYTHGHATGQTASGAFAVMIANLMRGESMRAAASNTVSFLQQDPRANETAKALRAAVDAAVRDGDRAEQLQALGEGWIAEEAFAIAVFAALAYPEPSQVLDALSLAVSHSGDSDSTGAICGNLIGAAYGEAALPKFLAFQVEGRATMLQLADDFIYEITDGFTSRNEMPIMLNPDGSPKPLDFDSAPGINESETWLQRYPGW